MNQRDKPAYPRTLYDVVDGTPSVAGFIAGGRSASDAFSLSMHLLGMLNPPPFVTRDAIADYREVEHSTPGLIVSNAKARIFLAEGVVLKNLKISSVGEVWVFIGKDAHLTNCEIACHAEATVFYAGFDCRLDGLFVHAYGKVGAVALAPGVTSQGGCNFCIQENSYLLIGDDSMLSTNVFVRTSDSHGIYEAGSGLRINLPAPVVLQRRVWVSRACSLNKGTVVGDGAVLGQGSIANGWLRGGCIHAGAPATMVKENIVWDRRTAGSLAEGHSFDASHFSRSYEGNKLARGTAFDVESSQ